MLFSVIALLSIMIDVVLCVSTPQSSLEALASDTEQVEGQREDLLTRLEGVHWNQMELAAQTTAMDDLINGDRNQLQEAMGPWTQVVNQIAEAYRSSMLTLLKAIVRLPLQQLRKIRTEEQALWNAMTEPQRKQFKAIVTIATAGMTDNQAHDFAVFIAQTYDNKITTLADCRFGIDWFDSELQYMINMGWDPDQAKLVMDKVRDIRGVHHKPVRRPFRKEVPRKQDGSDCCC